MTRREAEAVGALLRLLPHCHLCHIRPATRVLRSNGKATGGRILAYSCDDCAKGRPLYLRFSWADSILLLRRSVEMKCPDVLNPEPHPDHVNTVLP